MQLPTIIAHRGGSGPWPENTLAGFADAHARGWGLETDVRLSADGVAVCVHDATLDRVAGRPGRVEAMSAAELAAVRLPGGHRIPTLAELLDALPEAGVVLDLKDPAAVLALAAAVRSAGAVDRVAVTGGWDGPLGELRARLGDGLTVGLGWRAVARISAGLPIGQAANRWAFLPRQLAGPSVLDRVRGAGLPVVVWTVNDAEGWRRLQSCGAEAVISDRPGGLVATPVAA